MLPNGDKDIVNKIRDLSNAMYKQLGSSPNQIQSNADNDQVHEKSSGISNSNLENKPQSSKRAHASNTRSQPTNTPIQEEPLELTVQKSSGSEKNKQTKKQPKTAAILQQKKLLQSKKSSAKSVSANISKKNSKRTLNKTKTPTKKQKERFTMNTDIGDSRRPRRGAAIAASAAMMAQKVLDKQLSSANVAFSDESSTEDDCEDEENEDCSTNATHESEGIDIQKH